MVLSVLPSLVTDLGIFWVQYKLISIDSTCGMVFIYTQKIPPLQAKIWDPLRHLQWKLMG